MQQKLSALLNAAQLPGLRFVPIEFTPTSSKFAKQACQGVYIIVTDRNALQTIRSGLTIGWALKTLGGDKFEVDKIDNLLFNKQVLKAVKTSDRPETLPNLWREPLEAFMKVRAKYLIYPE